MWLFIWFLVYIALIPLCLLYRKRSNGIKIKTTNSFWLSLFILAFPLEGYAEIVSPTLKAFPKGCEINGFGFIQNRLIVNDSGKQSFYLIQNYSDQEIELQCVDNSQDFLSPSLAAKIGPLKWAAFASDIENLNFQCAVRGKGTYRIINCQEVLEICQYPRVKFARSNRGNYWVSLNKPQEEVIAESIYKGIFLHW